MTVLLTGYEPFDDHDDNPSEQVARRLDGVEVAGSRVVGEVLPVAYETVGPALRDLLDDHDPAAVVATGLAAGRAGVSVERVGVNVADHAGVPDDDGATPRAEPLRPGGADAHLASLPVVAAVEALLARGIPARVSNTAGTHLCNLALYETLSHLDRTGRSVPAGFVHLPLAPEQAARKAREDHAVGGRPVEPSMALATQVRAVETVVEVAVG